MDTLSLFCASLAWGPDTPGLGRWLLDPANPPSRQRADPASRARLEALLAQGWRLLSIEDASYPALLREISDPPGVLYLRGDTQCLTQPALAMVGARNGSPGGCRQARQLASDLAGCGFVIVSGLARGVDAAAHQGALQAGRTLAVLGHGPDHLYPACHRSLAEAVVASGGLLVTEFPPGQGPRRALFPQRNRLISGLCQATLVIEAAERSGSLVTARLAADQGREVFAMPGAVSNPFARGCNRLLRDGAQWLESAADVAAVLTPPGTAPAPASGDKHTTDAHPLLALVGDDTVSLEDLAQRSQLPVAELARTLGELEMAGALHRVSGGYRRH